MKILLLSEPNSVHTIKWAKALAQNNIEILIFGLSSLSVNSYDNIENIKIKSLNQSVDYKEGLFSKIKYLKVIPYLKKTIKEFEPDILHAHYASSYGLLGALTNFSPYIISVWGSDVFDFPKNSFIHKSILKYNLKKADKILSTSHIMAKETQQYTLKDIEVTPFGIDLDLFKAKKTENLFKQNDIVIGTIKTLEPIYGIEYLIKAFDILCKKNKTLPLKLLIVGYGSLDKELKDLVVSLEIEDKTKFTGKILHSEVPKYLNMLDIFVALSNKESFGVSIIEAGACKKPVVVSDAGGLLEVVENEITGFVVPKKNPEKASKMIEKLVLNKDLRIKMGEAGRERVKKLYNWEDNIKQMITIYTKILQHD